MAKLFCICTNSKCGHAPGERCGKAINESNVKPYVVRDGKLIESGGWICDECWERVRPDRTD